MFSDKRDEASAMGKQFSLWIDEDLCKACGICVDFCPKEVFKTSELISRRGYYIPAVVREGDCTGCRLCELLCPELAILVRETEHQPENVAEGK